ncbi:MAG: hypothetical protein RLZZ511_332 [Cyanobacteriota bacterium]|jgi:4-hydroxybenzoate polyprenyltransferase
MLVTESSPSAKFWDQLLPYLQMLRPANIVTAWADIAIGYAAAGGVALNATGFPNFAQPEAFLWLLLATTGLYGGGIVFNDVFDAELDAVERPERPIPSSRASLNSGILLGAGLLLSGVVAAMQVSQVSGLVAFGVALSALVYDAIGKHHPLFGPLNMGLCRGGNWLLGLSAVADRLFDHGVIALIPIIYIAAITWVSRGEVNGGDRRSALGGLSLLILVAVGLVALVGLPDYTLLPMVPLGAVWLILVLPAFIRAVRTPTAEVIRLAVRSGIIGLIALDASVAAGFAGWGWGLGVLLLLPLSRWLAAKFAVT